MGFDVSRADFDRDLALAQLIAQYTGDTSALQKLINGAGAVQWPAAAAVSYGGSGYSGGYTGGYSGGGNYDDLLDNPDPDSLAERAKREAVTGPVSTQRMGSTTQKQNTKPTGAKSQNAAKLFGTR